MPSSSPTPGAHAMAAATTARPGPEDEDDGDADGAAARSGIAVSSVTDSLSPVHPMAMEPIGRRPKDVLSQVGANPDGVNATNGGEAACPTGGQSRSSMPSSCRRAGGKIPIRTS